MVHEAQEREERLPLEAAEEPAAGVEGSSASAVSSNRTSPSYRSSSSSSSPSYRSSPPHRGLPAARVLRVAHGLRPERDWQQDIQRLLRGVGALVLVHPQQLPAHVAHGPVDRHRELVHVAGAGVRAVQTESTQDVGERIRDVSDVARRNASSSPASAAASASRATLSSAAWAVPS